LHVGLTVGWMDDFIYAVPSRTICSIQQLYISVPGLLTGSGGGGGGDPWMFIGKRVDGLLYALCRSLRVEL
jgi:hypothetical protein